jgi:phosphatidylglycerol:prolipoprotein diacylglycerol transferase
MMPTTYGVFAAAGCVTAVLWLKRRRARIGVSENEFWAAMWALLLGALIGAKALFVALGWEHYARGDLRFFADFGVGFVFFGGLAGALLAGAAFAALRRLDFVRGADYFAVALPLGHALGRVGCFFAGCCHGRDGHPVQLYEALGLGLIALACRWMLARVESGTRPRGDAFRLYLMLYGGLRILLDPLRADGRPERLLGFSYQQGIAVLVIALAVVWQALNRRRSWRRSRFETLAAPVPPSARSVGSPGSGAPV